MSLSECVEALRRTSFGDEGTRIYLGERWIDQYRRDEAADLEVALKRLLDAINKEIEQQLGSDFWITMRAYIERSLRELEPEEPLPEE
jgi:hypothetical protein